MRVTLEEVKAIEVEITTRLLAGELDSFMAIQLINEIKDSGFQLEAARWALFLFEDRATELFPELGKQLEYLKKEEGNSPSSFLIFAGATGSPEEYLATPGE